MPLKHKEPFSLERKVRLLESLQLIGSLAEMIKIEFATDLVDSKFKQPAVNNHAGQIIRSAGAITNHLASVADLKDREAFTYEYGVEMVTLIKHFSHYPTHKLREFNEGIAELEKSSVNNCEKNMPNKA